MKEVNEPNEFELEVFDLSHPYYWIFRVKNVRIKTLYKDLEKLLLTDPEELINASEYAIILEHADELKIDLQEKDNNETHTRGTN